METVSKKRLTIRKYVLHVFHDLWLPERQRGRSADCPGRGFQLSGHFVTNMNINSLCVPLECGLVHCVYTVGYRQFVLSEGGWVGNAISTHDLFGSHGSLELVPRVASITDVDCPAAARGPAGCPSSNIRFAVSCTEADRATRRWTDASCDLLFPVQT